ncbi:MAG TPA: Asp-tRNA(Asn)/Glu-tRNA(Gln) amidotransferase GatCAB subunit B [Candidatus Omnitrophica bacterium]|nr:Asp-tRNA(Asn)/Glu-tRNA(Gln) amidotransferase GatCAB subunit B [Candidatus Omnitrophota bacterium]HCI43948.1 Asp-tRNA(Asn)/Glu-tRNA(Gln) amidotransferase GatCAB subunit B [Candidatus Omnitrophota bacterium]
MSQTLQQKYETVIGLEVHLQLSTRTKIFCGCANVFGRDPNTQTCPVCLGLPGTLPVLNKMALEYALKIAMALDCRINPVIKFDRKNYYYPDLPKGYQISQYDKPVAYDGHLWMTTADGQARKINIKRAHLEEDAGKLIHDDRSNSSLVDYNRTGTPLMEIVSEPDLRSPQEAYDYLQALKLTLEYLHVSDCDMEKGSLRCDANVSIREAGAKTFGTKTELKNMNSFKAVRAALEFEEKRQREVVSSGGRIIQETRLWSEEKWTTITMRSKEEAHDYRYFPEPDLVPFEIDEALIEEVRRSIPELPRQKFERFVGEYGLSEYDARIIVADQHIAHFFEACAKLYADTKKICNWLNGPLLQEINGRKLAPRDVKIKPEDLVAIIRKVDENVLSNLSAKEALKQVLDTGKDAAAVIRDAGLAQVSDSSALEGIVDELIREHQSVVAQIREGKPSAVGFLIGQAMRKSQGKANPRMIGEIIRRKLSNKSEA